MTAGSTSGATAGSRTIRSLATMLTPEQLSERTGVCTEKLSTWRALRRSGHEIGPKFVKLIPSGSGPVRYLIEDVEHWEASLAAQLESGTAPPRPRPRWMRSETPDGVPAVSVSASVGGQMIFPYHLAKRLGVRLAVVTEWRRLRYLGQEAGPPFVDAGFRMFKSVPMYRLSDVERWEADQSCPAPADAPNGE